MLSEDIKESRIGCKSMEIVDALLGLVMAFLGGISSIWVAKKMLFSRQNIMESVDSVLEYALNTIEGQSKVKAVMEKLAEGLMKGSGITQRGKKLSLQDVLLQLGLSYAQSKGWLNFGQKEPQNQQQQSENLLDLK